ncbi:MAG: transposase [Planctomycetes bacterium]|nr:transposase [Planctomycetota bacterium]
MAVPTLRSVSLTSNAPASRLVRVTFSSSLHAKVRIEAQDREGLERLCRYIARPPIKVERLSLAPDGRVIYGLRRHWRDGTSAIAFEPLDFIARLAALVPRPRAHLLTYHGILAPAAEWRDLVVPGPRAKSSPCSEPGVRVWVRRPALRCRRTTRCRRRAAPRASRPSLLGNPARRVREPSPRRSQQAHRSLSRTSSAARRARVGPS